MSQRRPGFAAPDALVDGVAARLRNHRPAAVPTIVGRTSAGPAPGRLSTAAAPTTPTTAKTTSPATSRRLARTPMAAHASASTRTVPTSRARLSLVPNVATAKSLSHGGVRSMKAPPTAAIGAGCPDDWPTAVSNDAASVASPTVSSPATTPSRAPHHSGRTGCCGAVPGRVAGLVVVMASGAPSGVARVRGRRVPGARPGSSRPRRTPPVCVRCRAAGRMARRSGS